MTHPALKAMKRLEGERSLAPAATALDRVARTVLGAGRRRRLLDGRWLGHTFHALLTDFVEGPWMAATFLDVFGPPDSDASARRLLGLGLAVVPLAHLSGLADWQQADQEGARRVGFVHALTVSAATALYAGSYVARRRGDQTRARTLSLAGGVIALVDGYLGGHLSHVRAVAVGEQV
ncbi:MAG: (2Fe-2S)-binding protein [Actinobacteria bacterium]|nr:(2Fe-2S)-binding protein [Actinomycetota bacterium]